MARWRAGDAANAQQDLHADSVHQRHQAFGGLRTSSRGRRALLLRPGQQRRQAAPPLVVAQAA